MVYVRGSEADAGNWEPVTIGNVGISAVYRIAAFMMAGRSADSPIETILGAAIFEYFRRASKPLTFCYDDEIGTIEGRLLLIPQFRWSIYRSDWAIYNPKTSGALLVECDGKEFHSSAEQVAHDQKKDAAARDRGITTLRFSGSQIHKHADMCARVVFRAVYRRK